MGEMRGLERSGDVEKGGGQREQEKERERATERAADWKNRRHFGVRAAAD